MTTGKRKTLLEILECSICLEPLSNAQSALCGHVFCKNCVVRLGTGSRTCPECRSQVSVITAPIPVLNQLVDALQNEAGPSNACDNHPSNEKKFVCKRCMVPICSECVLLDHYDHNDGKPPATLEELKETLRPSLKQVKDWHVQQTAIQKRFDEIRTEGTEKLNWIKTRINELFEMQVSEIRREVNKMVGDIEEKNRDFTDAVDSRKRAHAELISVVSDKISQIDGGMKRGLPQDIISAYTTASKCLKNNIGKPLPSTSAVQEELDAINEVRNKEAGDSEEGYDTKWAFGLQNKALITCKSETMTSLRVGLHHDEEEDVENEDDGDDDGIKSVWMGLHDEEIDGEENEDVQAPEDEGENVDEDKENEDDDENTDEDTEENRMEVDEDKDDDTEENRDEDDDEDTERNQEDDDEDTERNQEDYSECEDGDDLIFDESSEDEDQIIWT